MGDRIFIIFIIINPSLLLLIYFFISCLLPNLLKFLSSTKPTEEEHDARARGVFEAKRFKQVSRYTFILVSLIHVV